MSNIACRLPGAHPCKGTVSSIWHDGRWIDYGEEFVDLLCAQSGIDPIKRTKSRGIGDTIAKVTSAVGIKPCGGCKKRQAMLNKLVPYSTAT